MDIQFFYKQNTKFAIYFLGDVSLQKFSIFPRFVPLGMLAACITAFVVIWRPISQSEAEKRTGPWRIIP